MKIGNRVFDTENKKYIMGILNVTPDSFSDGGRFNDVDRALKRAEQMLAEGADILDVGGESTRPGYRQVSEAEEIARCVPVIAAIKARFDVPVSVDTSKSVVAQECVLAGADLINDVWGFRRDARMAQVAAKHGVACCLVHNRENVAYSNFEADFLEDIAKSLERAEAAGISKDRILLDPGIGFAKSQEQNLRVLSDIRKLERFGCPILLGVSRKSVIGIALNIPVEERMPATVATTVYGAMMGCAFFRVHDVRENRQALDMIQAIRQA